MLHYLDYCVVDGQSRLDVRKTEEGTALDCLDWGFVWRIAASEGWRVGVVENQGKGSHQSRHVIILNRSSDDLDLSNCRNGVRICEYV